MKAVRITKRTAEEMLEILTRVGRPDDSGELYYPPEFVGPPAPVSPYAVLGAIKFHFRLAAGWPGI